MENSKMVRDLLIIGKKHYPKSRKMRHDWVRKSLQLYRTGRHLLAYSAVGASH
jgi:hypothetical protein